MELDEAIEVLKDFAKQVKVKSDGAYQTDKGMFACMLAIKALEKQIPKKPILKHDVSVMHINRGNQPHEWKRLESDNWHCPECDSFVGERVYVHSKVHDQRKKKYCDNCGQKLDWESDEE